MYAFVRGWLGKGFPDKGTAYIGRSYRFCWSFIQIPFTGPLHLSHSCGLRSFLPSDASMSGHVSG